MRPAKKTAAFLLFLFFLAPLGADEDYYPVHITDILGNPLHLEHRPQRVVLAGRATLLTANALYLFPEARQSVTAIGHTDQGLGNFLRHIDVGYDELAKLPYQLGPEQVLAQRPDLVVVKDFVYPRLGAPLRRLGIPVLALSLESPEAFRSDLRRIGEVFDAEERAKEIVAYYDRRLSSVTGRTDPLPRSRRPGTLLLSVSGKGGERAFRIPPAGWIQTFQVEAAGGRALWTASHAGKGWMTVGFEQIAAWDPDHIFITSYNSPTDEVMASLRKSEQWKKLRAMKNGKVDAVPADFYSWAQPDTRWILGIQWMARRLHPELFSDLNIRDEAETFYRELYDVQSAEFRRIILPRLEDGTAEF
jgi:iron complex transport system substrate-binding protein